MSTAALALAVLASLTACSAAGGSAAAHGCSPGTRDLILQRDGWQLPQTATFASCAVGDENAESYAVVSMPAGAVNAFAIGNGLDLSPAAQDGGVQHDIAAGQGWPISNVPYFTAGVVGISGMREQGRRGFQLTIDERSGSSVRVYLYSDGG